ncbi:30S ribosomal protein S20 [Sporolactobacillus inulinus]|uniref:Small ribosomal subunit protein bS20 n=1 Tax=Sporolactobacillus inulinus CASD TaxID=1069536 RepID=A0A0U1QMX5_9BACL|nr:30S ribosomal protein S20 [Sporolactobacillus inulinus]KLI02153.1 30S ribosomal protein S20 [Sporolactobacillus inulinus CASD]GEB76229.1 30S ribosomal protein S20 [Sporolactobacillus inulinus]
MPNIKSAIKRVKTSEANRQQNAQFRSAMRTAIKSFNGKVEEKDVEGAKAAFLAATKKVDKAASKGLIHKNKAAHEKSRLSKKLTGLNA